MASTPENEHPTPDTVSTPAAGTGVPDVDVTTADDAETTRLDPLTRSDEDSFDTVRLDREVLDADTHDTVRLTSEPASTDDFDTVQLTPERSEDPEFAALGLPTNPHTTDAYDTLVLTPEPPHATVPADEPAPATGEAPAAKERDPDEPRWWGTLLALPAGAFGAVIGIGPWILTGARLPTQELWATDTPPWAMPFALLPLSQTTVIPVFSFLVVGAALAGILGRLLRVRGVGMFLLELGVLVVQGWATVQATMVLREGLQDRFESAMYIVGLLTGTILSILMGLVITLLVASAPRAGALLGLTVGAIGMTSWTSTILFTTGALSGPFADQLLWLLPWLAPVLTGVAIAWTGVNTVGRVISTILALAMIWVTPAVTLAVATVLGDRAVFRSGENLIAYGSDLFRLALLTPTVSLPPVITAAVVAAVLIGIVVLVRVLTKQRDVPATR